MALVQLARSQSVPMVAGCDSNSHHIAWGSSDTNMCGTNLLQFIVGEHLEIINVGTDPTFVTSIRQEVIDITLASQEYANSKGTNLGSYR